MYPIRWVLACLFLALCPPLAADAAPFDIVVIPDQQCAVSDKWHCVHHLAREFGVDPMLPAYKGSHQLFEAHRKQLETRDDYRAAVEAYTGKRLDAFDAMIRWILEHKPALVINVGDSIDKAIKPCGWYATRAKSRAEVHGEWDLFMNNRGGRKGYRAILESDIPQVSAQGNHDLCGFEKNLPGNSRDHMAYAVEFSAGGRPALAVAMPWAPGAETSGWALEKIRAFTGPIFLARHFAVYRRESECLPVEPYARDVRPFADRVVMLVGGHQKGHDCRVVVEEPLGRVILALVNWQHHKLGGEGYLLWARFFPEEGRFELRTFSPYLGQTWETALSEAGRYGLSGSLDPGPFGDLDDLEKGTQDSGSLSSPHQARRRAPIPTSSP